MFVQSFFLNCAFLTSWFVACVCACTSGLSAQVGNQEYPHISTCIFPQYLFALSLRAFYSQACKIFAGAVTTNEIIFEMEKVIAHFCKCASLVTWDCATITRERLSNLTWRSPVTVGLGAMRTYVSSSGQIFCLRHVTMLLEVSHLLKGMKNFVVSHEDFVVWTTGPAIASRICELHVRCGRSRVLLRREQNRIAQANADKAPGPQ